MKAEFKHSNSRNLITPIIKVVDYCNYECDFCRYHTSAAKNKMDIELYKVIVDKAIKFNLANNWRKVHLIFHGGEPLLWGIDNFVKAVDFQNEMKLIYPTLTFTNSIQTNGLLLSQQWIDFFKSNEFGIGVSIDGPESCNFHGNNECVKIVLDNIQKMNACGCSFGVLSVITNNHKGMADQYYDFLVENNIHSIGLCYCMYDEATQKTVDNGILSDFLITLFERYYYGDYDLKVREFEDVIRRILNITPPTCTFCNHENCGNILSITPDGSVSFCDPYTLDNNIIGNIKSDDFFGIKSSDLYVQLVEIAKRSIIKVCNKCEVNNLCGGGCFRNVLPNEKNAFCDAFKLVYPFIQEKVQKSIDDDFAKNQIEN